MGGIATLMGPFLEYLRPTKSPYLLIVMSAVMVMCVYIHDHTKVGRFNYGSTYAPELFLPIYLVIICVIPLSFIVRDASKPPTTVNSDSLDAKQIIPPSSIGETSISTEPPTLANAKYENDLDSVFKFSRAIGIASALIMAYVYVESRRIWDIFSITGYSIIILQIVTFMLYMTVRQFHGEDLTDTNVFQIAFITTTLFCGATYTALKTDTNTSELFYRCHEMHISVIGQLKEKVIPGCNIMEETDIRRIVSIFRPDFCQITFLFLALCWVVYEIFWICLLYRIVNSKKTKLVDILEPG